MGADASRSRRLWLAIALWLVAIASRLVPRAERDEWRGEWEAELSHRWGSLRHRRDLSWRTSMDLVRRAFGALPDAAWIRRQLTADADFVHDIRHTLRLIAKTPGVIAIALLVFAVGIGATTAILSLADTLLVRPLPLPEADRIMTLWERNRATGVEREDVAPGNAIDWAQRLRSFQAISTIEPWSLDYTGGDEPEVMLAARVSEGFFDVLGVPMLHGRPFLPQEYRRGNERVIVLGYNVWQRRFGADSRLVGQAVQLHGEPYTVVGVLPAGIELRMFDKRDERALWLPKYFEDYEPKIRTSGYWNVFGRLKPDTTIEQARAELDALSTQLATENPRTNQNTVGQMVPLRSHLAGSLHSLVPLLLGAALLVLVVACANVANILIARGVTRGREFAVRQALGAGRGRVIRQMLAESLLLATFGGVLGLLIARLSLDLIASLRPSDVAGVDQIPLDARAALIVIAVTVLAAVVAGLAPAVQLSRPAAATALREGQSGGTRRGIRGALVVVEVALALLLVVGAGLLIRSFLLIQRVDPGFKRDQVRVLQVFAYDRANQKPEARALFVQRVLEGMRALPGIASAGAVSAMPFIEANMNIQGLMAVVGRPPVPPGEDARIFLNVTTGDYFQAMGIPLERGRFFNDRDVATSPHVVLVSRAAARKHWPGGDPLGSKVKFRFHGTPYEAEVVGIVGDARHDALDQPARAELYLAHPQAPTGAMTFVVRSRAGSPVTMDDLKKQVWALDPLEPLYRTATLDELVSRTLVGRRFSLVLLAAFAGVALLLAAAGLYAVISSSTSQRTREFGVRIALGAGRREIVGLVLREGLLLAVVGLLLGVGGALWLTRFLRSLLFGVTATDPTTFLAVGSVVLGITIVACYVPARRAIKVDPLTALRAE
jgi:putative ABC transport system permease protein